MRLAVEELSKLKASDLIRLEEPLDVVRGDEVIARIHPVPRPRRAVVPVVDPARAEAMRRLFESSAHKPRFELTAEERREIEEIVGPLDLD